jgi:hypothetical protein
LKKEAKTFAGLSRTRRRVRDSAAKVFWFFFSKKNNFLNRIKKAARLAPDRLIYA